MRVVKTKWFARFARKEGISDKKLLDAVQDAEKGLPDGELDAYQKLAQVYLSFSDAGMAKALSAGELEEIN